MNAFTFIAYLVIGGVIMGLSHNEAAYKCGHPLTVDNNDLLVAIAWPAAIAYAIVLNERTYKPKRGCE